MSSYETNTGAMRTITAFFANRGDADAAVEALVSEGFNRSQISVVAGSEGTETNISTTDHTRDEGGFWESLKDMFLPNEDRHVYAEGLRRGGYLVSLVTTGDNYDRALDILDDEGTIDLDERETAWRSEGWSGYTGADYTDTARSTGLMPGEADTGLGTAAAATATDYAAKDYAGTARTGATGQDDVIQVAEEQLRVGKREVSQGRVRVRSYVVETPVNEQVSLREEHVSIERRPVDRALTGNEALFQDRTIEVEQTSEEAVVSKDARVVEELVVNKDVGQRTETISDTVRRTEVEVEDERGNVVGGTTRKPGIV
jgi:uncharacterized protein (TIGR02271 family)